MQGDVLRGAEKHAKSLGSREGSQGPQQNNKAEPKGRVQSSLRADRGNNLGGGPFPQRVFQVKPWSTLTPHDVDYLELPLLFQEKNVLHCQLLNLSY